MPGFRAFRTDFQRIPAQSGFCDLTFGQIAATQHRARVTLMSPACDTAGTHLDEKDTDHACTRSAAQTLCCRDSADRLHDRKQSACCAGLWRGRVAGKFVFHAHEIAVGECETCAQAESRQAGREAQGCHAENHGENRDARPCCAQGHPCREKARPCARSRSAETGRAQDRCKASQTRRTGEGGATGPGQARTGESGATRSGQARTEKRSKACPGKARTAKSGTTGSGQARSAKARRSSTCSGQARTAKARRSSTCSETRARDQNA